MTSNKVTIMIKKRINTIFEYLCSFCIFVFLLSMSSLCDVKFENYCVMNTQIFVTTFKRKKSLETKLHDVKIIIKSEQICLHS